MNRKIQGWLISLVILCVISPLVDAETVYLKSGGKIEGKIQEQEDDYVRLETRFGLLTFYMDEIDHIEGQEGFDEEKSPVPPLKEPSVPSAVSSEDNLEDIYDSI